ncbi:MAG: hypothetical protein ETSY1_15095 [Candidatus Entotheonella factor]|uniref:Acyl-CoA dehydrogenase n=1 Tax=Entotheonella factor TaxID=1429438 RepID=W4LNX2_ENTF1|nr:MAG: hypothetical protein ETSY1_15095 [Candidatus Entotheonella factor]
MSSDIFPPFELGTQESRSRYARYESGRNLNYYEADANLRFVLQGHLDPQTLSWAETHLWQLGKRCGTDIVRRADVYDAENHKLIRYDKFGCDISQVSHHPDWLSNLNEAFDFGLIGWNYDNDRVMNEGYAPVQLKVAFDYLVGQADMAICCPIELATGAVVVLEEFADEATKSRLLPPIVATKTQDRLQVAQVLTEITGGSDVGASRTVAEQRHGEWYITGEKWFASNVGADLIFTMARVNDTPGTSGLAFFVIPRVKPDGSPNTVSIRRLKDKMGTIGVPTGELIFDQAFAHLIGKPDEGWKYMAEMLNHTRFWNAVGSLGIMRRAYLEAAVYAARRKGFGTSVDHFPMIQEQLVQLTVDLEATTALIFEVAAALEEAQTTADAAAHLRFRILAPVVKYRTGEQNMDFAQAAVEMLGGNGYVRDFGTPKLLRDAQVNTIWEGTSNICALDLLRGIAKQRGHQPVLERARQLAGSATLAPAKRLAETALHVVKEVEQAVAALTKASETRCQQQARRMAELVGDAMALACLTAEAERGVQVGNYRKALLGELFALRFTQALTPLEEVLYGGRGVPECYEALVADRELSEGEYTLILKSLGIEL